MTFNITRCDIFTLQMQKIAFGRGSAGPRWEAYDAPQTI